MMRDIDVVITTMLAIIIIMIVSYNITKIQVQNDFKSGNCWVIQNAIACK
jgi:hypothetical protein